MDEVKPAVDPEEGLLEQAQSAVYAVLHLSNLSGWPRQKSPIPATATKTM
jgi:hypothetical protein